MLVVRAAGQNPRKFGGRDLIADDPAPPPLRRLLRRLRELHVVRDLRTAALGREHSKDRSARPRAGSSATRTPTAASTSAAAGRAGSTTPPRRGPGAQARRRHGRTAAGAAFLARQQSAQRRLPPDPRRGAQRAVDGVRGPGPGGCWRARERDQEGPGLPALADRAQRARALLAHRAPDAGLGQRPGPHGPASPALLRDSGTGAAKPLSFLRPASEKS